ncbi:hypothetical protein [uncultured Corynebacterium sp.]|uniref:hypothetical protein n=1 Tax=uncultured Corynebacterium sp. TaxID=159447 RepID=UPI0026357ABC|nr:hypothetical protein [uncultured Corynebacterium sp.]
MKRFNKTAIAIALSGALALGVAPAADAQDTGAPAAEVTYNGSQWYLHNSGKVYVNDPALVFASTNQLGEDKAVSVETVKAGETGEQPQVLGELPATIEIDGKTFYLHENKQLYVTDSSKWNTPVDEIPADQKLDASTLGLEALAGEDEGKGENLAPNPDGENPKPNPDKDPETGSSLTNGQIAGIVAGALAGTLIIGGIVYKLVKDKQGNLVYVPEDKAGQEPTAADKAASDKLISENADEIKRQTASAEKMGEEVVQVDGADAADRGVNAETGNNVLAKGLIGLLLASIMGAAIFAYGRRQLV